MAKWILLMSTPKAWAKFAFTGCIYAYWIFPFMLMIFFYRNKNKAKSFVDSFTRVIVFAKLFRMQDKKGYIFCYLTVIYTV